MSGDLIGPAYIIIAGSSAGEGAVITKAGKETLDVWHLSSQLANNTAWLLQTNYDHWKPPPWFDDRRSAGMDCMKKLPRDDVNVSSLFNVLSAQPTNNVLTT